MEGLLLEKNFYVYGHFEAGICWYVGQGRGWRAWAFNQRNKLWRAVFSETKNPEVKLFKEGLTQEEALALEVQLIASYRLRGQALLNMSGGGERGYGNRKPLSASHKAAISAGKRGRSNGLLGSTMAPEHRTKISKSRLASDAVKAAGEKIWASRRANGTDRGYTTKKARPVRCIDTGIIYRCATEAADALNISAKHIQSCCVGRRKSHGGNRWEYQ